jgi:hypothetical protein
MVNERMADEITKNNKLNEVIAKYTATREVLGTILQKYKTGNEKVTDMLSDQAIPRIAVSHF